MKLEIQSKKQLIAWALARNLFGANRRMAQISGECMTIDPSVSGSTHISITHGHELVFSNENMVRLAETGFAFPNILKLLLGPFKAFKAIRTMRRINQYFLQADSTKEQVMVLIFGSLEAIAVYLNHQTFAKDIMQDECGRVEFYLEGNQFLGAIYKFHDETWLCDMEKNPREASVIVRFEDLKTGINAALGRVDPLIDPVQHRLRIEGRLPLLEKISYVSRMVSKELPLPIKSPYAAF